MAETHPIDPHQKALAVNLDQRRYGTFAEIGAGQEVVRWFFRAGGAAGTIAKSISAYDMTVSDAIYGRGERYVCRERLERMLEYEHGLNLERLRERRGNTTAFFVFADTVKARGFSGSSECHGWLGVRFQSHPRDADSQILIHVNMLDREKEAQQEALGIVGVNLVYGACFLYHEPELFVESLLDSLSTERIEIDMVELSGIEFRHVDNRVMSLKLVQLGLTGAAMFSADGAVLQPSEVLYKKPVLVERGSFRPVTHVNVDMMECALAKFAREPDVEGSAVVPMMEITMRNLMSTTGSGTIDVHDFLARADVLAASGMTVLISDYFEYYRLAAYLARNTSRKLGVVMGAGSLRELFDEAVLRQPGRRHPGVVRPPVQERPEALRVPADGSEIGRADHGAESRSRGAAAQALRVSGRPRLHRAARDLQPRLSAHLLARHPEEDQVVRSVLGDHGADRRRRHHQAQRLLRIPSGELNAAQPLLRRPEAMPLMVRWIARRMRGSEAPPR